MPNAMVSHASAIAERATGIRADQSWAPNSLIAARHGPIKQRRFFEVNYAIQASRNPVARLQHIAGNLGLHGIHIVH